MKQVQQAAIRAGDQLNERRRNRGMRPRPVRARPGFPNVGKSVLINRLVRQKVVASARRAGDAHPALGASGPGLDLLDAPGVLPPRLYDQQVALRLALCDDIGQAAYDGELVAQAPAVAAGCGIAGCSRGDHSTAAGALRQPRAVKRPIRLSGWMPQRPVTPPGKQLGWPSGSWMISASRPSAASPWSCWHESAVETSAVAGGDLH